MAKGKDFYGTEIAEVIEQACKELGLPREQLDIAVLETGSTGIFGLCKKKAHIRVQVKPSAAQTNSSPKGQGESKGSATAAEQSTQSKRPRAKRQSSRERHQRTSKQSAAGNGTTSDTESVTAPAPGPANGSGVLGASSVGSGAGPIVAQAEEKLESSTPTTENLVLIEEKLSRLLALMGLPSVVRVEYADSTILCSISGEHEEYLAGQDGKILDSLQYLLRKMIGPHLPERATLSLDAAGYREQRLERLKQQASDIAEQVRQSGKTRTISGLNPSERRAVHLLLQQDEEIRSRSVGSGLFKKILIYKPGKEGRSAPAKAQSSNDERQSND
ncbi:MAG: RNA-binding protein [Desulfobulbaceae bacterium]|nr:RNA-binding protein [Desulfobulbaceae bacterium]